MHAERPNVRTFEWPNFQAKSPSPYTLSPEYRGEGTGSGLPIRQTHDSGTGQDDLVADGGARAAAGAGALCLAFLLPLDAARPPAPRVVVATSNEMDARSRPASRRWSRSSRRGACPLRRPLVDPPRRSSCPRRRRSRGGRRT